MEGWMRNKQQISCQIFLKDLERKIRVRRLLQAVAGMK
jgi:hypothetical protein